MPRCSCCISRLWLMAIATSGLAQTSTDFSDSEIQELNSLLPMNMAPSVNPTADLPRASVVAADSTVVQISTQQVTSIVATSIHVTSDDCSDCEVAISAISICTTFTENETVYVTSTAPTPICTDCAEDVVSVVAPNCTERVAATSHCSTVTENETLWVTSRASSPECTDCVEPTPECTECPPKTSPCSTVTENETVWVTSIAPVPECSECTELVTSECTYCLTEITPIRTEHETTSMTTTLPVSSPEPTTVPTIEPIITPACEECVESTHISCETSSPPHAMSHIQTSNTTAVIYTTYPVVMNNTVASFYIGSTEFSATPVISYTAKVGTPLFVLPSKEPTVTSKLGRSLAVVLSEQPNSTPKVSTFLAAFSSEQPTRTPKVGTPLFVFPSEPIPTSLLIDVSHIRPKPLISREISTQIPEKLSTTLTSYITRSMSKPALSVVETESPLLPQVSEPVVQVSSRPPAILQGAASSIFSSMTTLVSITAIILVL